MRKPGTIIKTTLWILLLSVVIWSIVPILYIVFSSLKDSNAIFEYPPRFVSKPTFSNYSRLITHWSSFFSGLKNSSIIAVSVVMLVLVCSTLTAFAFSRFSNRRFIKSSAFFMIAIRMFPPIIITIPLFPVLKTIGLVDTHITLIMLYVAFMVSLATWIMKSFIDDIPIELEEAAVVDGCTNLAVLIRITLPLSIPGIITTAIFTTIFCWNEFLFGFIFAPSAARTAPVTLNEMLGSVEGVEWGPLFAATTLQLLPMLLITWTLQKYLVRGMTLGAVKL
jgi:multiple sugar transport system permease protein